MKPRICYNKTCVSTAYVLITDLIKHLAIHKIPMGQHEQQITLCYVTTLLHEEGNKI
jgi:hypothetical protein